MEIKKVLDGGQVNLGVHLDFKGSVLEQIVSTAFMVSSHTKFWKEWNSKNGSSLLFSSWPVTPPISLKCLS